jgi:hypothetical protein
MNTNAHVRSYLVQFFLECKMFQTRFVQKIKKTNCMLKNVFSENPAVHEIM